MTLDTMFAAGALDFELLGGLDVELLGGLDASLVADAAIVLVTGASVDFATTDDATTAAGGMVFTVAVDFNVVVMLDAGLVADATTGLPTGASGDLTTTEGVTTAAAGMPFAGADATRGCVTRGAAGRAATVSAGFPAAAGGGGVLCANISVSSPSFARSCATRVAYEPWRRTRLNWER